MHHEMVMVGRTLALGLAVLGAVVLVAFLLWSGRGVEA